MATFKVGDRVRKICPLRDEDLARLERHSCIPVGEVGTIHSPGETLDWRVRWDGYGVVSPCGRRYAAMEYQLAPLTPPAEDTWAADKVRELVKPKPMDAEREEVKRREREFDKAVGP